MTVFTRTFIVFFAAAATPLGIFSYWALSAGDHSRLMLAFLSFLMMMVSVIGAGVVTSWVTSPLQKLVRDYSADLGKERAKIDALVQNIVDGLVITNLRGEVMYMNAPAVEIFGAKPEEIRAANKGLYELIDQDQFRMKVQRILENNNHSEVMELHVPRPGGGRARFLKTTVTMFSSVGGEDYGVAIILRDISTERKINTMKEEFFQAVAHDLRAPLFAMRGYLKLLERSVHPDSEQKSFFEAIEQSGEKMSLFIQDTLDSARLETGEMRLVVSHVDAKTLIKRVAKLFTPLAEERGIELKVRIGVDVPPIIEADERLLERVFHNLVANALKFTPRGGRLEIAMAGAGDVAEFMVTDTGPGIPEDQKNKIFEKFQKLGGGSAKSGFGLGLNICQKIVNLHKGKIWVASEGGRGCQVIFRIPVQQPKTEPEIKTQPS